MATNIPPSSNTPPPGEALKRFARGVNVSPETLAHLPYEQFAQKLSELSPGLSTDTTFALWHDAQAMSHGTHTPEHAAHENKTHEQHAPHPQKPHTSSFANQLLQGAGRGVGGYFYTPQFMEEDKQFWKIIYDEKKVFAKENKRPGWSASKEEKLAHAQKEADFLYGDLDDEKSLSLEDRAKQKLKQAYESDLTEKGKPKSDKQKAKDAEKLKRYAENEAKITKKGWFGKESAIKFHEDRTIFETKQAIEKEASARAAILKKQGLKGKEFDQSYAAIMQRIKEKKWKQFFEEHPEKAAHFASQETKIKNKHEKEALEEYKNYYAKHLDDQKRAEEALLKKQEAAPVIDRGKVHTDRNAITSADATARLEATAKNAPPPHPSGLILPQSSPTTITKPSSITSQPLPSHQKPAQPSPLAKSERLAQAVKAVQVISDPQAAAKQAAAQFTQRRFVTVGQQIGGKVFGQERFGKVSGVMGKAGKAMQALTSPKAALQNWAQNKIKDLALQYGKKLATQVLSRVVLANPYFWIVVGIVILIIIIVAIVIIIVNGGIGATTNQKGIPGLTLTLSGPTQVQNSENIQYTIKATYTGTADITLSDPLPTDTTFVSATGNYTCSSSPCTKGTVQWKLKDNTQTPDTAGSATTKVYTFTLILHPERNDIIVKNKILANGGGGTGAATLPPNANSADFATLMKGQGRNVGVLGDENSFVAKIMASGEARVQGFETLIRTAYKAGVAQNVNPLILITLWGEESGYDTSGTLFSMGCGVYVGVGKDFASQATCAAKTMNYWMSDYEKKAALSTPVNIPSVKGTTCNYDDPFLYAAEWYGPVCHADDSNDHFQSNFHAIYKKLLGN